MSSASKRRESSGGDEGGGANWMDTYGDLVTLLLCFFVLLFSFSSVDAAKWEALVGALSGSTATAIPVLSPSDVIEQPIPLEVRSTSESSSDGDSSQVINMENFTALAVNITSFIAEHDISATVEPDPEALRLIIRFADNILFESGSDALRTESLEMLQLVGQVLEANSHLIAMIRIEGHTDDVPINTARFRNNWDLSAYRSLNALQYVLSVSGIDPRTISSAAYGEFQPADTNETSEGRSQNRRVDFVVESLPVVDMRS